MSFTTKTGSTPPASVQHVQPEVAAEEVEEDVRIREMFTIPSVSPPEYNRNSASAITKPVALPRVSDAFDSPFARAYAPELEAHGIPQDKWLEFVDGLSYSVIASPPLQILDTAGRLISVVPFGPALVASLGSQVASKHVLSRSMTDKYLSRANKEYFESRGLRVRLMRGEALKTFSGMTANQARPTAMGKLAKGAESFFTTVRLPIVIPIAAAVLDAVKPLPPTSVSSVPFSAEGTQQNFVARRMAPLLPYIAPLDFDVPPSKVPEGVMQQAKAAAMQYKMNRNQHRQFKEDRRRAMGSISRGEMSAHDYIQSMHNAPDQSRRAYKDERKAIGKAYKQEGRSALGVDTGSATRRGNMAERRDLRHDDKFIWLVLYPIERDAEIRGVNDLDSTSPLQISDGEYEAELEAYEREGAEDEEQKAPPAYHST